MKIVSRLTCILLIVFLAGCSSLNEPSLKVKDATVNIRTVEKDISVHSSDGKEESFSSVYLSYNFGIKNTGFKAVEEIEVKIEPGPELAELSTKMFGINIFDKFERERAGFGIAFSGATKLTRKEEGVYQLDYNLGVLEQSNRFLVAPSTVELEYLLASASDATLIVTVKDKELGRVKLDERN